MGGRGRFVADAEGINQVTGEDCPEREKDGRVVSFFEKGGHVITRDMLLRSGVRVEALAANPRDALINVAMKIINILKADESGQLERIDHKELSGLISILDVSEECLSDKDRVGLQTHLRNKGFLCRIER